MRFQQALKKSFLSVTVSLMTVMALPAGIGHAAPQQTAVTPSNLNAYSVVQQIFHQYGIDGTFIQNNTQKQTVADRQTNQQSQVVSRNNKPSQPANPTNSTASLADRIIQTGEKYLGTPYKYGAPSGQTRYFDCSLFVQTVFKENGINLPRSSREQALVGTYVPRDQLQKGDLVFFTAGRSDGKIGHVGIYAGNNKILHTYGPGGVRYDSMSTPWLDKTYVTARRVIR
ncbi:C40 family peptidase [Polycladomyces subterraneus]|uniref:NlpC/P60 family protein n=1 Tax=Polycladomyces subterraneus TaxID=1016997 RepID=A0ABT8IJP0_9BACL|nr:C40 family peptidase [Polycladomyces subterraneus]MDN4592972.1 NlpC/P60 family protein [Polycladomyces subterraneus]